MSLINGTLDQRRALLDALNLRENPFSKTDPADAVLDQIFVGREAEIQDAAWRMVDRPRNLLIFGGHGCGKTTFLRKLLRELGAAKRTRFLTGYAALRHDSPLGLQVAALAALVDGILRHPEVDAESPLHGFASTVQQGLATFQPGLQPTSIAPDQNFQEGLRRVHDAGFDRVVLALDEVDKREADVVLDMLRGARFLLDMEASFLFTGSYLDVFQDVRSSMLAVFDHRIELPLFSADDSRHILRRNLAAARCQPEAEETISPFDAAVVEQMVLRSRGLPRPLNLMAGEALNEALNEGLRQRQAVPQVTMSHLERALEREGNIIYGDISTEERTLLARVFKSNAYASGQDLYDITGGARLEVVRRLESLSRQDAVLRLEAADGAAFALSPPVEQVLAALQQRRQRLRALWERTTSAESKQDRGRALEDFAAEFFGDVFHVRERNARTDTEELDLVLEPAAMTDPRFRASPYLIVECKNWPGQRVQQVDVTKLFGEMELHHLRQGFLLTTGSITQDARQQARYAFSSQQVEIVLLDGEVLRDFLADEGRSVADLLVAQHARQMLRVR